MAEHYGIGHVDVLRLGVDTKVFDPAHREPGFRKRPNLSGAGPLLVYAGRIDNEKRIQTVVEAFRRLPKELEAALVLFGDGKLRSRLMDEGLEFPMALKDVRQKSLLCFKTAWSFLRRR